MKLLTSLRSRVILKWKKILFVVFCIIFSGGFYAILLSTRQLNTFSLGEKYLTEGQKLKEMGSRYAAEVVEPNKATVYVEPDNLLIWTDPVATHNSSPPRILIVVASTVESFKRREMIRSTWKKWTVEEGTHTNVKTVFFIGLPKPNYTVSQNGALIEESALHNDLVIDNFVEGYFRLTPKTIRMLKWYLQTYTSFQSSPDYFIKTDHDVFINIPNLVSHLVSVFALDKSLYIGGKVNYNPMIDYNPQSKFYFSPGFWLNCTTPQWLLEFKNYIRIGKSLFPNYVSGFFYIMSADVINLLYEASFITPLVLFEDLYITGFVRRQLPNVSLHDIPFPKIERNFDGLKQILRDEKLLKETIALHPADPPEFMKVIYDKVLRLPGR